MVDDTKLHQFMGQMLSDLGGAASVALVRIGDALGLYKTLHARGPMTVAELAAASGVNAIPPSKRPAMNRTVGCSRAAAATASTLSRLMLTSASATPQAALAKLRAGLRPLCSSPAISGEPGPCPWRSSRRTLSVWLAADGRWPL